MSLHPDRVRDLPTLLLVVSLASVLSLPYLAGIGMLDEGALVHLAERIADGEVLYRDLATGIMPGAYYLHALLFLLFSPSLLVGRILMMFLFVVASGGVFLLLRKVTSRGLAGLISLCFIAVTVHYWRYPNYSPQAILWILGMLGAAIAFLRTRRQRWLVLSAMLLGMALVFKQNYGALASLGLAGGLMAAPVPWKRRVRDVTVAAVVAAVPLVATGVLLALAGAWPDFWHFTVEVPLGVPMTVFARPFPPLWGAPDDRLWRDLLQYLPFEELFSVFPSWAFRHTSWSMLMIRLAYYLPVLLLGVAAFQWVRRRGESAVGVLLLLVSGLLFLGVFPRVDAHHLILVLAPWFVCMGWLAGARPRRGTVIVWSVAAAILVAASCCAQIATVLDPQPYRVRDAWLPLPRGGVWVPRSVHASLERSLREIEEYVPPDEPLFVAPASPMHYFLSGRRNPTRYPLILPGAMDEEEVIRNLAEVRWGLVQDGAFEDFTFENVAPVLWEQLHQDYRLVAGEHGRIPLPPYLVERAPPHPWPEPEWIGGEDGVPRAGEPGVPRPGEPGVPKPAERGGTSIMLPSLSTPPPYLVLSRYSQPDPQRLRASWSISYLRPSLLVVAPWGWQKLVMGLDTRVQPGAELRFSVALDPESWGTPGTQGQGGVAEIWISREDGEPRRVWQRWLDPRRREEDRRWHTGVVDLSSFVEPGQPAQVFLVSAPSPGLDGADAKLAWSGLELSPAGDVRFVDVEPERLDALIPGSVDDLALLDEAVAAYPESAGTWSAHGDLLFFLDRIAEAIPSYTRAVELEPENPTYRFYLDRCLETLGRSGGTP